MYIFTRIDNFWPWESAAGRKLLVSATKVLEILRSSPAMWGNVPLLYQQDPQGKPSDPGCYSAKNHNVNSFFRSNPSICRKTSIVVQFSLGSLNRCCPYLRKLCKTLFWCKTKGLDKDWWNVWCPFSQKVLFLANIRCCPNFLDYALECCGFDIENYFWNAQVWLTTPIWMDWIKEMCLWMPNHIQKSNP